MTQDAPDTTKSVQKVSFLGKLRSWFFTGLLVTAPVLLTLYITWLVVDVLDSQVVNLLPASWHEFSVLNVPIFGQIPGFGLLIGVIIITLIGAVAAGFLGRWIIKLGEKVLNKMPVVRSIYSAFKQILETVLASQSDAFRDVVLVQYPREGLWVIGFVTGVTKGEVQDSIPITTVNVFVPTTPNPTSGFLLFCPKDDLIYLKMTVEQALKLVVSGGIVTPETVPAKA
jgi:uncharacterized membrane protein